MPSPADYDTANAGKEMSGGRFGNSNTKSDIDWLIYYAKQKPGTVRPSGGESGSRVRVGRVAGSRGSGRLRRLQGGGLKSRSRVINHLKGRL